MMSLRAMARTAPRALFRASTVAARPARSASSLLRSQPLFRQSTQVSTFSTSILRRAPSGETDEELSAKLGAEIEFEVEVKDNEGAPTSVKDFLENGPFEIEDTPGKDEVKLTRTFGNEKITVSFSIADLHNYDPDMYDEDAALGDEEGFDADDAPGTKSGSAGSSGNDLGEDLEAGEEADEAPVPCRLNIIVEKPGKGALSIEASASDGAIIVENMYHYADAALAHGASGDAIRRAGEVYAGPPFGSLDEDLQVLMERYLEERGVTQALAVFVPDYMDMKEQKEYLAWLNNVKNFVDA